MSWSSKGVCHLMGLSSRSLSRLRVYSKKGGVLCHRRRVAPVLTSSRSRKGLLPSGEAPVPACQINIELLNVENCIKYSEC